MMKKKSDFNVWLTCNTGDCSLEPDAAESSYAALVSNGLIDLSVSVFAKDSASIS